MAGRLFGDESFVREMGERFGPWTCGRRGKAALVLPKLPGLRMLTEPELDGALAYLAGCIEGHQPLVCLGVIE